ncbi:MAG TPA: hypothetical protein VK176_16320 [Phycisphaerales bacterium]|nr:hypothetical protein [Phycisphaerales bacterium]
MKLVGLMLVRNEDWILGFSLRAALMWCDQVLVMLDTCTDRSADIWTEVSREVSVGRVKVSGAHFPATTGWEEMLVRQQMLEIAVHQLEATHCAIIDADECLSGNLLEVASRFDEAPIRKIIAQHATRPGDLVSAPMVSPYDVNGPSRLRVHPLNTRRIDGYFGRSSGISLAFRVGRDVRWQNAADGYTLHHRHPHGSTPTHAIGGTNEDQRIAAGGVIHWQYASKRRLQAKALWYKLVEQIQFPGRSTPEDLNEKYGWTLRTDGMEAIPVPDTWIAPYAGLLKHLNLDAEPWQLAEARRLAVSHPHALKGLDTYGLL